MNNLSRRSFVKAGTLAGAVLASPAAGRLDAQAGGFTAAGNAGGIDHKPNRGPGLQYVYALCETTGGGTKVYGVPKD